MRVNGDRGAILGYLHDPRRGVESFSPTRARMCRRRAEIVLLGRFLAKYDPTTPIVQGAWAQVIADVLLFISPKFGLRDFQRVASDARIHIDDHIANTALDEAAARRRRYGAETRPINGKRAGAILALTCEMRLACNITTLWAVDETEGERAGRVADKRRRRDRERKRVQRAGHVVPRQQYEANSVSRLKPWEGEGVSRATWYRRRQKSAISSPSATATSSLRLASGGLLGQTPGHETGVSPPTKIYLRPLTDLSHRQPPTRLDSTPLPPLSPHPPAADLCRPQPGKRRAGTKLPQCQNLLCGVPLSKLGVGIIPWQGI